MILKGNKSNNPESEGILQHIQVLRILEKMYDGKFWNIENLAHATAMNQQVTRRCLDNMHDQAWVKKTKDGQKYQYRITARALLRPHRAGIDKINQLLDVGAPRAVPEKEIDNAK